MKPFASIPSRQSIVPLCAMITMVIANQTLCAGDGDKGPALTARGGETEMDLPSSSHKYYGQNVNHYVDKERKVAKLDVDGDMNYDGVISNEDPADNGAFESTPPGLVLGVGELTKLELRLRPYRIDFQGDVVVAIEVGGINREAKSGRFKSFEQEKASVGRIRIWKEASKKTLLVDSGDPSKLVHEFVMDAELYPANLPGIVPRTLYVEGVSPSGKYAGDVRLLTTASHRKKGTTRESFSEDRKKWAKSFRTTFDHMLFTVKTQPLKKGFVNNNSDGVWVKP